MLCLTGRAMAQLAIQGLVSRQLELHFPAMAARLVFDVEVVLRIVHFVRRLGLPVVFLRHRLLELCLCRVHLGYSGSGESTSNYYWCSETESCLCCKAWSGPEEELRSRRGEESFTRHVCEDFVDKMESMTGVLLMMGTGD